MQRILSRIDMVVLRGSAWRNYYFIDAIMKFVFHNGFFETGISCAIFCTLFLSGWPGSFQKSNKWPELTLCNIHFRAIAEHVRYGVLEAGCYPLEFPVSSRGAWALIDTFTP